MLPRSMRKVLDWVGDVGYYGGEICPCAVHLTILEEHTICILRVNGM